MALENHTGSPNRTGPQDRPSEVAPTIGEHEALLDHHIEEMLGLFSDLAPTAENAPGDVEHSIE